MPWNINKPAGNEPANLIDDGSIANFTALDTAFAAFTNGVAQAGAIILQFIRSAGTIIFKSRVSGDSQDRFQIEGEGKLNWGPGNAPGDVWIARGGVDILQLGDGDAMRSGANNRFLYQQAVVRTAKSTNQSIPHNSITAVTWDIDTFDTDGLHDVATNNTRLTAKVNGKYMVFANLSWSTSAATNRIVYLQKNGVTTDVSTFIYTGTSPNITSNLATLIGLAAGDYLEVKTLQDTGAPIDVIPAGSSFGMVYVGQ